MKRGELALWVGVGALVAACSALLIVPELEARKRFREWRQSGMWSIRFSGRPIVRQLRDAAIRDADAQVRRRAIVALTDRLDDPGVPEAFARIALEGEKDQRERVIDALEERIRRAHGRDPRGSSLLFDLAREPRAEVRSAASVALRNLAISGSLDETFPGAREAMLALVDELEIANVTAPAALDALSRSSLPEVRERAAAKLRRSGR